MTVLYHFMHTVRLCSVSYHIKGNEIYYLGFVYIAVDVIGNTKFLSLLIYFFYK